MTPDLFTRLVTEAALAPSVHNTQPARWHLDGESVVLFEDLSKRLPVADPEGRDAAVSMGAALEGMVLAAADAGLTPHIASEQIEHNGLRAHVRLTFDEGETQDPLASAVGARQSWRGAFAKATDADRAEAHALAAEDCTILSGPGDISEIAKLCDKASLGFMLHTPFRQELLSWMRLRSSHRRWSVDGLNADALQFSGIERVFAGVFLGPAFGLVRALGLAPALLSEASKTRSSAGILVFHRPVDEDPIETGRAFYRAWLRCEAHGFGAAVLAALADDGTTSDALANMAQTPRGHRIVSVFRIGRRPAHKPIRRARCKTGDLIV